MVVKQLDPAAGALDLDGRIDLLQSPESSDGKVADVHRIDIFVEDVPVAGVEDVARGLGIEVQAGRIGRYGASGQQP